MHGLQVTAFGCISEVNRIMLHLRATNSGLDVKELRNLIPTPHLRWEVGCPPTHLWVWGWILTRGSQPAKLPSFSGYFLETLFLKELKCYFSFF